MISTDGYNFEIIFTSNFLISSHAFSANDNMIQFNIESGLEEENIGEIVIPRDLIDGEFTILLDGEEISYKINKTNRSSVIVIEFDGKGGHTLEIIATKYIPMFSNIIPIPYPNISDSESISAYCSRVSDVNRGASVSLTAFLKAGFSLS